MMLLVRKYCDIFVVCLLLSDYVQKHEGARKEITILDTKRSNAINIGLTTLPKPDAIKAAIMKLDNSVINREAIEVSWPLVFM